MMQRIALGLAAAAAAALVCGPLPAGDSVPAERSKEDKPVPVVHDDFSDGKLRERTGKDPWGRPLPEWTVELKKGKVAFVDGSAVFTMPGMLELPCKVVVGTWKWRYRYPKGCPVSPSYGISVTLIKQSNGSDAHLYNPSDGHWWLDYWAVAELGGRWPRVPLSHYIVNMVGSQIATKRVGGSDWHEVVVARDAEGYFYTWLDGTFVRWSLDRNTDIGDSVRIKFSVQGATTAQPILLDDIQVYDGVVLPPRHSITHDPEKNTIVLDGFDITVEEIAKCVNKPSVFSYDAAKRTAVCAADLFLKTGAHLVIENATLKMDSSADVKRRILFSSDVSMRLNKATITTTGEPPFQWQGAGKDVQIFNGILSVTDSTVNNFGGLTIRGIDSLHLENGRFTNLVGKEPLHFAFTVPTHELTVRGCLFEGKTGAETIVFKGGDQFAQLRPEPLGMDFVDCEFRKVTFLRRYDNPYYQSPGRPGGTANLVNCRLEKLSFNGTTLRHKYYLDVQVVTASGKGVRSASVMVLNEQDDLRHPAENLLVGQEYLRVGEQLSAGGDRYFTGQQGNWFKGWVDVNDQRVTLTGRDGHTPLPKAGRETLVVTASVQTATDRTSPYTYTIRAESFDGKLKGEVKGVKPDASWFRAKANVYSQTVKLVVK